MRVLAITKIFPNAAEPLAAPFNRQQFAALAKHCQLEVMATVPWYPGAGLMAKWSSAGKLATVPARDRIAGIDVTHPRTLFVPRIAHSTWGPLYAASIAPQLARYRGARKIDVVLGSWVYPDGFAAVIAGLLLGVPSVIKLHGSDVNVIAKMPGPRLLTRWALPRAERVVAVSRALAEEAVALGAPRERVAIVMNGVDEALFHPRDRAVARAELGLPAGPLALYVGNLKEVKGVLDLAAAWTHVDVPEATLVVVGDGPLQAQVAAGLAPFGERARMVAAVPLERVPVWMAACDVLVLPSHAEGTPNVVLEALACGRRVVATAVGGVPDVLAKPELGALAPPHDPAALGRALATALRAPYDPIVVAALGARGGWDASAAALYAVLVDAVDGRVKEP